MWCTVIIHDFSEYSRTLALFPEILATGIRDALGESISDRFDPAGPYTSLIVS